MDRQVKDGQLSVVQAQASVAEWTSTRGDEALRHYLKRGKQQSVETGRGKRERKSKMLIIISSFLACLRDSRLLSTDLGWVIAGVVLVQNTTTGCLQ